jgi:hypothetical protein
MVSFSSTIPLLLSVGPLLARSTDLRDGFGIFCEEACVVFFCVLLLWHYEFSMALGDRLTYGPDGTALLTGHELCTYFCFSLLITAGIRFGPGDPEVVPTDICLSASLSDEYAYHLQTILFLKVRL